MFQELSVSRGTIGDLTQQLAMSHVAREDGAYRAARFQLFLFHNVFADLAFVVNQNYGRVRFRFPLSPYVYWSRAQQ